MGEGITEVEDGGGGSGSCDVIYAITDDDIIVLGFEIDVDSSG